MGIINVNLSQIKEFETKTNELNNKLIDVLNKMKKDSLSYETMLESSTGDLYKKVMIRELDKEINRINDSNLKIVHSINTAHQNYLEYYNEVKESING